MRYIAKQKAMLPPMESLHGGKEAEDYLINDIKRHIVIDMIDKLPFNVKKEESPVDECYEYEIKLDIIVKDTQEEIDKLLNN